MSGRWWRAYSRARHDPKLLKLSDKHFRWWFNLVCVAADNDGVLPSHADLAVEFRTSPAAMTQALDALVSAGLLDHDETGIHPHNWNGLQYKHDVSTERVKRFRQRRETVSETPSESETEADTETEGKNSAAKASPGAKRGTRLADDFKLTPELHAFASDLGLDPEVTLAEFADYWRGVPGARGCKLDWPATFRNRCRELAGRPKRGPVVKAVPSLPVSRDDDGQWRARVSGWQRSGFWMPNEWGPAPGSPGSRVPAALLTEETRQ